MNIYFPESSKISQWTEWHLTTKGWQRGSQLHESDDEIREIEIALDRVLTCRYHENVTINSIWMQKHINEIWKDSDQKIVDEMLEKFGDCPQML
ncbi:hypothetical protein [Calothrix sp. PCC 6303]|uniref:hypothetical protein n=1 Tax=Calothrix sp. PCC 6303 TaxID=1170562 RepID=UPI0002A05040|nr:hypothetical protein [Calothrix sp. PCC 6303]AFY99678.1 hypothetical protein Cal6303_0605 [Calothrix sp. PCC 6303]